MPSSEAPGGKRKPSSVPLLIALAVIVCSVALCAGGYYLLGEWGRRLDPNYTRPEEISARESALRQGGPAELDAKRVETALNNAANAIVAQDSGVRWHWSEQKPENLNCDPYRMFHTTPPEQIVLRRVVFTGKLTDAARERAIAALEAQAKAIGASQKESFTGSDGRSGVTFSRSPNDIAVVFTSGWADPNAVGDTTEEQGVAAVVEGRSACLFPQQYFTDKYLPS